MNFNGTLRALQWPNNQFHDRIVPRAARVRVAAEGCAIINGNRQPLLSVYAKWLSL